MARRLSALWLIGVLALTLQPACHSSGDIEGAPEPGALPAWLEARPCLQNRSLWRQDVDMASPIEPGSLGCIGVGNGRVYGNIANHDPLASWHNLGGPTYQKGSIKWFSDKEPRLMVDGRVRTPNRQSISRVRNTPVVIVEATDGSLEWTSVNFAPVFPGDPRLEQALVSIWIVRNLGDRPVDDVAIEVTSILGRVDGGRVSGGIGLIESDLEERRLTLRPVGTGAFQGDTPKTLVVPMGDLAPGGEAVLCLPTVFTCRHEEPSEILAELERVGVDALLDSTVAWWDDWAAQITDVRTPDEKFNDLLRGLAVSIKINTAVSGAVCEMNQYSHTWLRDIYGPALFCPLIGLLDDYKGMIDYVWGATLVNGNIANAMSVDLDLSDLPSQPDWERLGTMGGRTRAESPSFLVLEYERYYEATGDLAPIDERWGMLRHALLDQKYVDGCLLHFSSDETFEDIMEAIFGENLLEEPDESTLSLYSSLLVMRAARFMADMADRLGYGGDAHTFAALADRVEACLEETFWLEDEGVYAVKAKTDTRVPHRQPYEDVSTMPIWLDALPLESPRVIRNFETILEALGHPDGLLYSPIPPPYRGLLAPLGEGAITGMSHGYWLNNLDKLFHPTADIAFSRWPDVFSATGFTDEAMAVLPYRHLSLLREPFGMVCDVSSRFRSWEAGVMGYALLYHLTGIDVSLPAGTVRLAPQLPPGWGTMTFERLAYGEGRFDVEVGAHGDRGRSITVTTDSRASFTLELRVPLTGTVIGVSRNDRQLDPAQYRWETNRYGRTIVTIDPIEVGRSGRVEVVVSAY